MSASASSRPRPRSGPWLGGHPLATRDELIALLTDGDRATCRAAVPPPAAALADFDAATIETTHGFCRRVLHGLGVAGDVEDDDTFVEDVRDLVDDVVDDLYLRKFAHRDPSFTLGEARRIGREVVTRPDTVIEPAAEPAARPCRPAAADGGGGARRGRATQAGPAAPHLRRPPDAAGGDAARPGPWPGGLHAAARAVRRRDGRRVPGHRPDAVGDRRAGVRRRGHDARADRRPEAGDLRVPRRRRARLPRRRERRPDGDARSQLAQRPGPPRRVRRPVRRRRARRSADPLPHGARLRRPRRAAAARQPVRHRAARSASSTATTGASPRRRSAVAPRSGRRSPTSPATWPPTSSRCCRRRRASTSGRRTPTPLGERGVDPADVAVLVATHREAAVVRDALGAVGVPAVSGGDGSVFETPSATEWLRLLQAIERPSHVARVHAAALTCFVGWSATQVATADGRRRGRTSTCGSTSGPTCCAGAASPRCWS